MRIWMSFWLAALILISCATFFQSRTRAEANSKASEASQIAKGKQIYEKSCAICHFSASTAKKIGPGLKGLMKRQKFRNGMKADSENLRRVIERGGKDMPGSRDSLSEQQVVDLIAYLKTL